MSDSRGESRNGHGPSGRPGARPTRFAEPHKGLPIAYRHQEVITTGEEPALAVARAHAPNVRVAERLGPFMLLDGLPDDVDPLVVVHALRSAGFMAQPNHTHFHHAVTATPVYGYPVYGYPVYGYPVYGYPVYGYPTYGSPVYGSPVYGSPVYGGPADGGAPNGGHPRISSARPVAPNHVTDDMARRLGKPPVRGKPQIHVLDTGLAAARFRPEALHAKAVTPATAKDVDKPDANDDGYLDMAAGHGTFIAGIISQAAPGCRIAVHKVLSNLGEGQEWDIATCIYQLVPTSSEHTIVNLSFGGYVLEQAHVMEWAIRELLETGAVIVASAGNDGTCRPAYPAALPGVLAVGALGADGPAHFTNYGPWVNACAPGVDLVSTFFANFKGRVPPGPDGAHAVDEYQGWASWSGTSFSAPVVVGNLARMMLLGASSAHDAVRQLVHAPAGMSVPNLGRVVNAV